MVGGVVVGNDPEIYETLKFHQNAGGAVPGPFDCWLVLRGIKTLPVRMERHSRNGLAVAEFLREHPAVRQVFYPGLADHPGHDVAARQMRDFSGMVSFTVRGDFQTAAEVARSTRIFQLAVSLGGRGVADRAPRADDARQRRGYRGRGRGHPAAPLGRDRERGRSHRRSEAGPRGGRTRDGHSLVSAVGEPPIRPYPYPSPPPALRPWNPRAPEAAARVVALIAERLPDTAVEHVGSSSVPGCAGKGYLDLVIPYRDDSPPRRDQ